MRLTKNERACLEGARRLAEEERFIGPTSPEGLRALRRLHEVGLVELVGWTAPLPDGTPLYRITMNGRSELESKGLFVGTLPVGSRANVSASPNSSTESNTEETK